MQTPYPRALPDERLERRRRDPLRWLDRAVGLILIVWIASFTLVPDRTGVFNPTMLLAFAFSAIFPMTIYRSGRWGMLVALLLVIPHFWYHHMVCDTAGSGPGTDRLHLYHDLFIYIGPYVLIRTAWVWAVHWLNSPPVPD